MMESPANSIPASDYAKSPGSSNGTYSGIRKTVHIREPYLDQSVSCTASQMSVDIADSGGKLEDQINLQHLEELMTIFNNARESGRDGLDVDEFKAAFEKIMGKMSKNHQQIAKMFMKIDTDCDGTLDWDEFCTYMLLEYQEKDSMMGEQIPPFPFPLKRLPNPHKNPLSRITAMTNVVRGGGGSYKNGDDPKEGNIVTVSKDGLISFWKSNLTLNRTVQLECKKPKLLWVTDMVVMANIHKMVLSFTDCVLAVHDLLSPSFQKIFHVTALPHCAVALDYWYDESDYDHAILSYGDVGGGVCIMEFTDATGSLFGVSTSAKNDCLRIPFAKLQHQKLKHTKMTYLSKVHADWVNKIKYWSMVEGVLSCSCDSNTSLVITNIYSRKESDIFRVWKGGINTFDYSKEWNVIATGGKDSNLRLWNPYVSAKPTTHLKGHSTTIVHVTIVNLDGLIFSLSKDFELRVWSIHDQHCLQTCHHFQHLDIPLPCVFYYHSPTASLLVGSNELGVLEFYREENQKNVDIVSHERSLCGALYNSNFNQVVSACHGSVVSVWDLDTGEKIIQFSKCHGIVEITAMAFDSTGRRLITGARDGSIKLWNFNNGACLSNLKGDYHTEITCFTILKQKLFASGWSRIVSEYTNMRNSEDSTPKYWGRGIHTEDIICMAHLEPDILATASFDGAVVIWDVEIEQPLAVLNENTSCNSDQHNKLYRKLVSLRKKKSEAERTKGKRTNFRPRSSCCTSTTMQFSPDMNCPLKPAGSRNIKFGCEDNTAVESLIFLTRRQQCTDTANLIVAGAGGIVQFWNTFGGGLIGEFTVFDTKIRTVACLNEKELKTLHAVTSCKLHSNNDLLITGSSLGHIQQWDISEYCIDVPVKDRPVLDRPRMINAWKGHFASVVSIDIVEEKNLIITASTDCCVSLWTTEGRYIGTFGEKQCWKLPDQCILPRKVPTGLSQVASFNTIQTIAGPSQSKWTVAKRLFQQLVKSKQSKTGTDTLGGSATDYMYDESHTDGILGESYKRTMPYRQPVKPAVINMSENQVSVYSSLTCSEIHEPEIMLPPVTALDPNSDKHSESDTN